MNTLLKLSLSLIVTTILVSCNDDTEQNDPTSNSPAIVQFGDDFSLPENGESKKVTLNLSKNAPSNGFVSIKVTTDFPDKFQTEPAVENDHIEILISKGDTEISFDILPIDDQSLSENKNVEFELTEISPGFSIGSKTKTTITLLDDEAPASVNFAADQGSIPESDSEGFTVYIALSTIAPEAGEITIQLSTEASAGLFTTEPVFDEDRKLKLPVIFGASDVSFKVIPVKDPSLQGHQSLNFNISEVSGAIIKGTQLSFELIIIDGELIAKPKSYDTYGGGWRVKYAYHYNTLGQVSSIDWENYTPNMRSGTYTYYYADNGLIERVNQSPSRDEYFYQENGRIVKSEVVAYSDVVSYSLYDYDPAGNIGAKLNYIKNPNGEYVKDLLYVYLYFDNGNIYKQLTYIPGEEEGEEVLISTRTFDAYYGDKINHFPMFEVIHGVKSQPNLPTYHRVEENGMDLQYNLSYEFDANGNAISRTVTGSGANEITYYEYY